MATMALPISELSAVVTVDAAAARKKCIDLVIESVQEQQQHYVAFRVWLRARAVNRALGHLAIAQEALIEKLRGYDTDQFTAEVFESVACDLDRIVGLTYALIDQANDIPEYLPMWRPRLERIGGYAAHIDSFAESFHIAADPACTAVLAETTRRILADVRATA